MPKPSYDKNHKSIKAHYEALGGVVLLDLASYHCPLDFIGAFRKQIHLIEIKYPATVKYKKTPYDMLTDNEKDLCERLALAHIPHYVVQTNEDVQAVMWGAAGQDLIAKPPKFVWR
jgi:hypothetical protein